MWQKSWTPTAKFANWDFRSYHLNLGEVHCGTNTRRTPPAQNWWDQEV